MNKSDVVSYFGTQRKVAEVLKITEGAVSNWPEKIPHLRAYQLHVLTDGDLPLNESIDISDTSP